MDCRSTNRRPTLVLIAVSVLTGACVLPPPRPLPELPATPRDFSRPLPLGTLALEKLDGPRDWPRLRLAASERPALREACQRSLNYLEKASSKSFFPRAGLSHSQIRDSVAAFAALLDSELSEEALLTTLQSQFDCYRSVGCDDEGAVLFTGYYTPIFDASLERTARFSVPLHSLPKNHVKDPRTGTTLGLRRPDGSLNTDYPGRAGLLNSGQLTGLELAWLAEPFEAYIVGVQGSACLRLQGGQLFGVGYAGTNGKPYSSIARALIAAGKLHPDELSLKSLINYFRAHPEDFAPLAASNERYVFFQEGDGTPRGCLNEPVTALHSIATDKTIFPRAALCFVEANQNARAGQAGRTTRRFALDQDAGGAIRAPGRCDIYMGIGDAAGDRAGRTLSEGRLYYFVLKTDAASG